MHQNKKSKEIIYKLKPYIINNKIFNLNLENYLDIEKINKEDFYLCFPKGLISICLVYFKSLCDTTLKKNTQFIKNESSISKRILCLLKYNLLLIDNEKELSLFFIKYLITKPLLTSKVCFKFADFSWKCLMDKSVDFNYYTKRGILFNIYFNSLYYWNRTQNLSETNLFIERQINSIKYIGKVKKLRNRITKRIFSIDFLKYLDFNHK